MVSVNKIKAMSKAEHLAAKFEYPYIMLEELTGNFNPVYKLFPPDKRGRSTVPALKYPPKGIKST